MKKLSLILGICCILQSCYDYKKDMEQLDMNLLPKIEITPSNGALANGIDTIQFKVFFPKNSDRSLVKVNFITKEGSFYENDKKEYSSSELFSEGGNRFIVANLKTTTKQGKHNITIEVPNVYKRFTSIVFLPSYPSIISTSTNKFAVASTFKDEIQLFAKLSASKGLPSEENAVKFIVADSITSDNSRNFRALTRTDANGQASVFFTPGSLKGYTGLVPYKVITTNESGNQITASGSFEVVEPEQ